MTKELYPVNTFNSGIGVHHHRFLLRKKEEDARTCPGKHLPLPF